MAEDFEYISHTRLVYHEGYRYAYLGEVIQPVIYGVQGALRTYYGTNKITWDATLHVGDEVISLNSEPEAE